MAKHHHIFKSSLYPIFLTEHYAPRMQDFYWFPESPKIDLEPEPSVIKLLSCGIRSQFGFGRQTPFAHLRVGLKPSSLTKLIVRVGPGEP